MIAKVIAHGRDRDEALARLHRALSQMTVLVRGGTTNKSFLLDLLDRPEVRAGRRSTRRGSTASPPPTSTCRPATPTWPSIAAVARRRRAARRARPGLVPRLGEPRPARRPTTTVGREIELRHGGQSYRVQLRRTGRSRVEVELDGMRRRRRRRAARPGSQPADDRRAQLPRRVVDPGQRPPRRGRRGRPPLLPRRRRHRAGAGRGARRRRRRRARRRRRGRRPARRRRGDEDGDRHPGARRRTGSRRLRDPQRAGRCRRPAVPHRAGRRRRRRRAGRRRASISPRCASGAGGPDPSVATVERLRAVEAFILGFDIAPATARRCCLADGLSRPASAPLDPGGPGDPRRLRRPRRRRSRTSRPRRRRRRRAGPTRATSTPTCARWTSSARACRHGSGDRLLRAARPLRRDRSRSPSPELEEALLRIFIAQQRRDEQLPIVTAVLDDLADDARRRGRTPCARRSTG